MHLQLAGITKRYGSTPALENFTVEIPAGNIVALIGLNGAGKTTLLRCLSGIVAPDRGVISYDRQKFHRDRIDLRRRLMFLPDFPAIYADMNVLQHVSLMLRIYERDFAPAEEVIMQTLAELDLLPLAEAPVAQMSRGQLYKVALSALVAVAPDLWLLDEPFASGLDPQGIAFFKNESRAHAARGGTVLYSTQILEIAEKFCDRLLVIDHGGLAANYTRQDLISFPAEGPESLESRLRQFREIST